MRSTWKGTISFGLVSIPIKLFVAVSPQSIGFRQLCKKCMQPVKYAKHCPGCQDNLEEKDIIRALETGDGEYVTFTDEELESIKPKKSDAIMIKEFIDASELDPLYFQKFYFAAPQQAGERAYYLFKEVLKTSDKVAIGRFVMREKEYVCAISNYGAGLTLAILNYMYEINPIDDIKELRNQPELNKDEIELAIKLVNQLYEKDFDLSVFKDNYADDLRAMLSDKTHAPKTKRKPKEAKALAEKPLMEALKASLKG